MKRISGRVFQGMFAILVVVLVSSCKDRDTSLSSGKDGRILRVYRQDDGGCGTGFVVSGDGHVITNLHVVTGSEFLRTMDGDHIRKVKLSVCWAGEKEGDVRVRDAKVLRFDRAKDLALLKVERLDSEPLALFRGEDFVEENVRALGYPGVADEGFGLGPDSDHGKFHQAIKETSFKDIPASRGVGDFVSVTVTRGIVENIRKEKFGDGSKEILSVRHGAAIGNGNSGGPLINDCNEVVGVNTQGLDLNGEVSGRIQAAVHVRPLIEFLEEADVDFVEGGTVCRPNFYLTLWISVGSGVILVSIIGAVFYLRMSKQSLATVKERVVQSVLWHGGERGGRRPKVGVIDPVSQNRALLEPPSLVLEGVLSSGSPCRLEITKELFARHRNRVMIGRSATLSHAAVRDDTLSKQHLAVIRTEKGIVLEDVGAKNGSWLSGRQLKPRQRSRLIRNGDQITLGKVNFEVTLPGQS